jgi:hypothetical protein
MQADFNTGRYENPGVTYFPTGKGNAFSNPDARGG